MHGSGRIEMIFGWISRDHNPSYGSFCRYCRQAFEPWCLAVMSR